MKKCDIPSLIYQLASPVALILLGLILVISPDSATVLLSRLVGWAVFLTGVGFGIAAIVSRGQNAGKIAGAIVCLALGSFLLANPYFIAAWIGRFLGLLLILRGVRDFLQSTRQGGKILSLITAVLGLILLVLPMTTSRLVFSLCGIVILLVGIAMLLERLRSRRYLNSGDDNIIDAL